MKLVIGQTYYVHGLDMKCRPTVDSVVLVQIIKDLPGKCVVREGGIRVLTDISDLRETR